MQKSFIEEARRAQLIEAAIETLNEVGYSKTSLAKIAKKAGVSTGLTLYHFKDKHTLMAETLAAIYTGLTTHIIEQLHDIPTARQKIRTYIEVHLAYMGTRPKYFGAMIELAFARDLASTHSYHNGDEDEMTHSLEHILLEGQKNGEFKDFDPAMMALMINGTIDQFLGYLVVRPELNLEAYAQHIISVFEQSIVKEGNHE